MFEIFYKSVHILDFIVLGMYNIHVFTLYLLIDDSKPPECLEKSTED